jgi:hypothetical protein
LVGGGEGNAENNGNTEINRRKFKEKNAPNSLVEQYDDTRHGAGYRRVGMAGGEMIA